MKRILVVMIVISVLLMGLCGCDIINDNNNEKNVRIVKDMSGNEVQLPQEVHKYAVAWAGTMDIVLMLDGSENIVAYPEKSNAFNMIFKVYPEIKNITCLPNEGISTEMILNSGAEVVFMKNTDDPNLVEQLRECNIPVIDCGFDDYEGLKAVVTLIADVIGTDEARKEAGDFCTYMDDTVRDVKRITAEISQDERESVIVLKDSVDYSAYGASRYTGKWVEMCGGEYIMKNEDSYANVNLTKEQLLEYNPDIVFFAMPNQAQNFLNQGTWKNMKAVKNNAVYNNPCGFNTWSNCGAESALQFKWAISIMYPELLNEKFGLLMEEFYQEFYEYSLSDDEMQRMLKGTY